MFRDLPSSGVSVLLDYLYLGRARLSLENGLSALEVSRRLNMRDLFDKCRKFICPFMLDPGTGHQLIHQFFFKYWSTFVREISHVKIFAMQIDPLANSRLESFLTSCIKHILIHLWLQLRDDKKFQIDCLKSGPNKLLMHIPIGDLRLLVQLNPYWKILVKIPS